MVEGWYAAETYMAGVGRWEYEYKQYYAGYEMYEWRNIPYAFALSLS
jgi:hypothetical protein